ncbi:MAG: glycosyltransferase [bacterium]|nr:glycosyltransferase [bacterium]
MSKVNPLFKIGIISPVLVPDDVGMAISNWTKFKWLLEKGIDVKMIGFSPKMSTEEIPQMYRHPNIKRITPFFRRNKLGFLYKVLDIIVLYREISKFVRDRDIIEIHGWSLWNTALILAWHRLRKKKVIQVFVGRDGWDYIPAKFLDLQRMINRRYTTVANSYCLKEELTRKGLRIDGVIWTEVDKNSFLSEAYCGKENYTITVKDLYPIGGADIVLEAIGILKKKGIVVKHKFLGEGPLLYSLKKRCRELGIEKNVEFMGHVKHHEVSQYLKDAQIKILGSRLESCPHVVGEAMIMGPVVVSTRCKGAEELIQNGKTGIIVKENTPEAIASEIMKLLGDKHRIEAIRENARKFVKGNLVEEVIFEKFVFVYKKLMKEGVRNELQLDNFVMQKIIDSSFENKIIIQRNILMENSKPNDPSVFIIILNHNGREDTIECLESIKAQTYDNYKVCIVDNASTDGSQDYFKKHYPRIMLIENKANLGFAEANNIAIRHAMKTGFDSVLLLNNDTKVALDMLSELIKPMKINLTIGIAGPKMYYYDKKNTLWFARGKMDWKTGVTSHVGGMKEDTGQYDKICDSDFISGCALLIHRNVISKIGLMDERYFYYQEDIDYCTKAIKAGFKCIVAPRAKLWHKVARTSGGSENPFGAFLKTKNRIIFMKKNATIPQIISFSWYFGIENAIHILSAIKRKNFKIIMPRIKGVAAGILA